MTPRPTKKTETFGTAATARITDLARRILLVAKQSRWAKGHHLTESDLVNVLGVSRTPVRAALRQLEEQGIVEARPRRGYFLRRGGRDLSNIRLKETSTAEEDLYVRLLRDRIAQRLPHAVTASQIFQSYAVNRYIVGRVLTRLSDEGLVQRGGGHAWRFAPALDGVNGVRLSYEFRLVIEPAALLLKKEEGRTELDELRQEHIDVVAKLRAAEASGTEKSIRIDPSDLFNMDARFHETLASLSGNHFIVDVIRQQNKLRRLLEFGSYSETDRVISWCGEHLSILDAVQDGRLLEAATEMQQHLATAMKSLLTSVERY